MTRTTASTTPHVNGVLVVVRVLLVERHFACLAQLKHTLFLLLKNAVVLLSKVGRML